MFGRQKVATIVAEFLGTGVLTLVFLSVLRSQLASAGVFASDILVSSPPNLFIS